MIPFKTCFYKYLIIYKFAVLKVNLRQNTNKNVSFLDLRKYES